MVIPNPITATKKLGIPIPRPIPSSWADDEFEEVPVAVRVPLAVVAVSPSELLVVAFVISMDCPIDVMGVIAVIVSGPATSSVR
jgi:hypothetical protein